MCWHEVPRTLQKGSETLQIGDLKVPFWEVGPRFRGRGTILGGPRSCLGSRGIGVWWSDATPCHKRQHGVHRVMHLWDTPLVRPLNPRVGLTCRPRGPKGVHSRSPPPKRGKTPFLGSRNGIFHVPIWSRNRDPKIVPYPLSNLGPYFVYLQMGLRNARSLLMLAEAKNTISGHLPVFGVS